MAARAGRRGAGGGASRGRVGLVLLVVALSLTVVAPAAAQISGIGAGGTPAFQSSVPVGAQNQPALIQFVNHSFGTAALEPITVSNIRLNPSCAISIALCPQPEPRPAPWLPILRIDPPGGRAGTACAGITFTVSAPDASGTVVLVPSSPVVLGPAAGSSATCIVDFTFDVVQRPLDGATFPTLIFDVSSAQFPGGAPSTGSSMVVVTPGAPTITTQASPQTVPEGQLFSDTAVVTGVPSGPAPTGAVTFRLFRSEGPAFPDCLPGSLHSVSPPVPVVATAPDPATGAPRATATHAPAPAPPAGAYAFVATYDAADADVNYASVTGACADPLERVTVLPVGERYFPLSPARIADSRFGTGGLNGPLGPNTTVEVQVAGRGGVPAGASAVVLNVTATQPTAVSFLTLFPAGTTRPLASNLNFVPGQTVPNLVVVRLGTDGKVATYNLAGQTHAILDVAGYFDSGAAGNAGRYQAVPPARIADTRINSGGVRLGPGQSFDLQVSGRGGAPATGAAAAVLNVAATNTTAASFLTIYPTGEARPGVSNLNFDPGDTVSNRAMVKLGSGGRVTVYNAGGGTDVVVDLSGTYTDASVAGNLGGFTPLDPARILDTRDGTGGFNGPVPADGTVNVAIAGKGGVPASGARAVVLSVVVTQPAAPGFLTIFPAGTTRPLASDVNYEAGETRSNLVVVQLGANGTVGLYTLFQAHVIFDVAGWFS